MRHSRTDLPCHVVFGTKYRTPWIEEKFEDELYDYIGGIIRRKNSYLIEIGGIEDHLHILACFHPLRSPAGMVGTIKSNSSRFGKKLMNNDAFSWQTGYGAFAVSRSQVSRVAEYIQRQKQHHKKMHFEDEIRELYRRHGMAFDETFFQESDDQRE